MHRSYRSFLDILPNEAITLAFHRCSLLDRIKTAAFLSRAGGLTFPFLTSTKMEARGRISIFLEVSRGGKGWWTRTEYPAFRQSGVQCHFANCTDALDRLNKSPCT